MPRAVVLNSEGALLGAIEQSKSAPRALDAMNPNPQTIRPDMTPRLATQTVEDESVPDSDHRDGKYLGRYVPDGLRAIAQ